MAHQCRSTRPKFCDVSGGSALQSAVIARAQSMTGLAGTFDGPPARAPYPYLVADCSRELDWGTKDRKGREVSAKLTLWDDEPARLQRLADALEDVLEGNIDPADWVLANWRFVSRETIRDVAGPWAISLEYRARMLALP